MSLWSTFRRWRKRRHFDSIGRDCHLPDAPLEVKGHVDLGNSVTLRGNLVLRTHKRGRIRIGDHVEMGDYTLIQCNELVEIGAHTYIGPYVVLRDTNHLFHGTDVHWRLTPHDTRPIRIGAGCYVGAGSYIMPGVTIGDGAIVAPRSIITKDIPPCDVWGGSPAKRLANRLDDSLEAVGGRQQDWLQFLGRSTAPTLVDVPVEDP